MALLTSSDHHLVVIFVERCCRYLISIGIRSGGGRFPAFGGLCAAFFVCPRCATTDDGIRCDSLLSVLWTSLLSSSGGVVWINI
jgi:hypothetical protein